MDIIQKLFIKQVLTEKSKTKLLQSFEKEKEHLERECQQLLFEKKKLSNKLTVSNRELQQRFEMEYNKRKDKIKIIDFKIEQLETLKLGQEIVEKEMECVINIDVGDNWEEKMERKAIIIQDGIVIRIDK